MRLIPAVSLRGEGACWGCPRHTVENRLRSIEEKLGHSLRTRQAELEVALQLEELQLADVHRST